ncbi:MAG: c-type cytochrome [Chloroflexi bacterium]|nr:c-type cytochrome [Chloroflexota bacterium]
MNRLRLLTLSLVFALALLAGTFAFSSMRVHSQDVGAGKQVYEKNCAACHGSEGQGNLGIPNLAGAAGHVRQLGVPLEQLGPAMTKMLRDGIPGNMPAFPPEILSDADIGNLGAYLFSLPPTSGRNLYVANCALCHGSQAQGTVGPPLAGVAELAPQMGMTKAQIAAEFPTLVRRGIPGKMPANPQLTDGEIGSLFEYLWGVPAVADPWAVAFQTNNGRAPTAQDRADREWSLQFAREKGRSPTQEDWERRWFETHR